MQHLQCLDNCLGPSRHRCAHIEVPSEGSRGCTTHEDATLLSRARLSLLALGTHGSVARRGPDAISMKEYAQPWNTSKPPRLVATSATGLTNVQRPVCSKAWPSSQRAYAQRQHVGLQPDHHTSSVLHHDGGPHTHSVVRRRQTPATTSVLADAGNIPEWVVPAPQRNIAERRCQASAT